MLKITLNFLILVFLNLNLTFSSLAQQDTASLKAVPVRDSLLFQKKQTKVSAFQPRKSALLAISLSAVVPGAGQLYNEDYWKIPIIWGLGGYWIYEWTGLNNDYKNFRDKYDNSLPYGNENYKHLRDFYRDERDKFAWYIGALYFLNLVDAYVGAHLYDFDVSPNLSLKGTNAPGISASVRFKF